MKSRARTIHHSTMGSEKDYVFQNYMLPKVAISEIDLAYIAGLLDAEGSFRIQKRSGERGYCMQVVYLKAHYSTLEYLADLFGGNVKQVKRADKKELWSVTFSSRKAYRLLKQIYPFILIKKKAAEYCLDFFEKYWEPYGVGKIVENEREQIGAFYANKLKGEHRKSWPRKRFQEHN